MKAQMDYNRFLELDPQARDRLLSEVRLFKDSGNARLGETEGLTNGTTSPGETNAAYSAGKTAQTAYRPAFWSDKYYSLARDNFTRGNYNEALQWAQCAEDSMPQARIHAIKAQALIAQGFYRGAAAEARAAASMGPLINWATLYNYYNYNLAVFDKNFKALQEYVRNNPSSSDARFLLGYLHLILEQEDQGHAQLSIAAVLSPTDVVPLNMLARDGVEIVQGQSQTTQKNIWQEGAVIADSEDKSVRVASRIPPPPATSAANPGRTEVRR